MTEQRTAQILHELNTYTGENLWQDVILGAPWYDDAATDEIDEGRNDRFAATDGTVIAYAAERQEWVEDE